MQLQKTLAVFLLLTMTSTVAYSQVYESYPTYQTHPICPTCFPVQLSPVQTTPLQVFYPASYPASYPTQTKQAAQEPIEAASRGPSDVSAVRIPQGCGTGTVVSNDYNGGSLILTNAHVAGTTIGRVLAVNFQNGQTKNGRVVMAAYSDTMLTDWAILFVEGYRDVPAAKLASKKTTGGGHYTRGSPRCVWPLTSTSVTTVEISNNSALARWQPNSIGGQSGSSVWSERTNLGEFLLTWTWGGLGAGQQTSEIFRQARDRTNVAAIRPEGLELPDWNQSFQEPQNGFFSAPRMSADIPGRMGGISTPKAKPEPIVITKMRSDLAVGFFAQTGITDLPIWGDLGDTPTDPTDPVPGKEFDFEHFRAYMIKAWKDYKPPVPAGSVPSNN